MRMLFVDDEAQILDGLRRLLFDLDDSWSAHFVTSGVEGLAFLAANPVDVVISDMRMPGMDGVSFLEQVQERYPKSIRMVLSGQTDERAAIRALKVAHQFLSKPFDAAVFCRLIEQTASLTRMMDNENMRQIVGNVSLLPPPPALYAELTTVLQREDTTANDIVRLVSRDPTMAAKLLRMVNSAFFTRRVPTADLKTAIVHLGMNTIRHLVLTAEVFQSRYFWEASQEELETLRNSAMTMARIAESLAAGSELRSEAFTMGLLADIGQNVLVLAQRAEWIQARNRARGEGRPLHEVEYEVFGISHAEVGAFLLGIWGLPFSVVEAVAHHHRPDRVAAPVLGPAAIAAIANSVVYGSPLDAAWVERLGIADRVDELRLQLVGEMK